LFGRVPRSKPESYSSSTDPTEFDKTRDATDEFTDVTEERDGGIDGLGD